jgi:PAS domain S-box-containing protein
MTQTSDTPIAQTSESAPPSAIIDGYAIVDSMPNHVAVLHADGTILATNAAWTRFALENGNPSASLVGAGSNYLSVCMRAVSDGAHGAQAVLSGIKDVIEGKRDVFSIEYPCDSPTEERWFKLHVLPLKGSAGRVVATHIDITTIKRNEMTEASRRHQQEMKVLLNNSPDAIVRLDREARCVFANRAAALSVGVLAEELLGKTPRDLDLPTQAADLWLREFRRAVESRREAVMEFSYLARDAHALWEVRIVPEIGDDTGDDIGDDGGDDGGVQWVLFSGRDITERRRMEKIAAEHAAEIRALLDRLVLAEEDERRRVSRELHDNFLQQLASVSFSISEVTMNLDHQDDARRLLMELKTRVHSLTDDMRRVAYGLHPAVLDDLGLAVSLHALAERFADEHGIRTDLSSNARSLQIPAKTASALYRIAQECLYNIAKYAQAKHVAINLNYSDGILRMSVEDDGVGFVTSAARGSGRLGVVSMEERARLIGATFAIESQPNRGTKVSVVVGV